MSRLHIPLENPHEIWFYSSKTFCTKCVLEPSKIAKFEHRCILNHSDFVPLALETYGGTSEKYDKLIEKLSSKAAEINKIPYPILLNYWKKRISTTLQFGNKCSHHSEAYRRLFNFGAETLQRDLFRFGTCI